MPRKNPCQAIESLLRTMQILRSPQGCLWDAEQTPMSLTPYILEEACELIDAIESGNEELIMDELGDLLLQVVFQAQIHTERGSFDFADVADAINTKLLRRHPHVFSNNGQQLSAQELDQQWERIKQSEKLSVQKSTCLSEHLPSRLPALQRAQKLVSRMRKTGLRDDLKETPQEHNLTQPQARQAAEDLEHSAETALGWELFRIVQRAEDAGLDAERSLRQVIRKILKNRPPDER